MQGIRILAILPTCSDELDHLNAAAFAHLDLGHVLVVDGVVERVVAARVVPAVALEALDLSLRWKKIKILHFDVAFGGSLE